MKKVFLPLSVILITGNFTEMASAADAAIPGWGTNNNLTETEEGVTFTDSNGNSAKAKVGDGLVLKTDDSGQNPTGFNVVTAVELGICLEADPTTGAPIVPQAADTNTADTASAQ